MTQYGFVESAFALGGHTAKLDKQAVHQLAEGAKCISVVADATPAAEDDDPAKSDIPADQWALVHQRHSDIVPTGTWCDVDDGMAIAVGEFSTIYKAYKGSGEAVAVKCFHTSLTPCKEQCSALVEELSRYTELQHPNVASILSPCMHSNCRGVGAIMEYFADGGIDGFLSNSQMTSARKKKQPKVPFHTAYSLAEQIAAGMQYLHGCGVVHGDLKPSSVLLCGTRAALSDYGIIKPIGECLRYDSERLADGPLFHRTMVAPKAAVGSRPPRCRNRTENNSRGPTPRHRMSSASDCGGMSILEEIVSFTCSVPSRPEDLTPTHLTSCYLNDGEGIQQMSESQRSGSSCATTSTTATSNGGRSVCCDAGWLPEEESRRWIYMAPEVFLDGRRSSAMDVYSYGMLLYEIFYGRRPLGYHPNPVDAALSASTCGERPHLDNSTVPASINCIIKRCWAEEPALRPSFSHVRQWLKSSEDDVLNFTTPRCFSCSLQ